MVGKLKYGMDDLIISIGVGGFVIYIYIIGKQKSWIISMNAGLGDSVTLLPIIGNTDHG
jgi:hypothetical protein